MREEHRNESAIGTTALDRNLYSSLPPLDEEFRQLFSGGDLRTASLSVYQRQQIVDFAQIEALRLVSNKIVPDGLVFPVDMVTVANRLGVEVSSVPVDQTTEDGYPIDGMIWKKAGEAGAHIRIAAGRRATRVHFTICHELGHFIAWRRATPDADWLAKEDRDVRCAVEGDTDPKQYLANSFAHMLLMPDYALAVKLQEGLPIRRLAWFFGVSPESVRRRMTYLDIATQTYPETPPQTNN